MQQAVLPWACRLSRTVPADVIFQELQLVRWDDALWRRLLQFWTAMATVAPSTIRSHVFRDSLALASQVSQGCPHTWTAQVYACLEQHGVRITVATGVLLQLPLLSLNWQLFASGSRPCMLCLLNPAQRPLLGPCSAHTMGSSHGLTVGRL